MPDFPLPDVSGWPQAGVALGILAYLAWKAWLDSGRAKDTNAKVNALEATANTLEATLTTTNGGSHVKDQLNRIEDKVGAVETKVDGVDSRVTALEGIPRSVDVTVHPVEIERGDQL